MTQRALNVRAFGSYAASQRHRLTTGRPATQLQYRSRETCRYRLGRPRRGQHQPRHCRPPENHRSRPAGIHHATKLTEAIGHGTYGSACPGGGADPVALTVGFAVGRRCPGPQFPVLDRRCPWWSLRTHPSPASRFGATGGCCNFQKHWRLLFGFRQIARHDGAHLLERPDRRRPGPVLISMSLPWRNDWTSMSPTRRRQGRPISDWPMVMDCENSGAFMRTACAYSGALSHWKPPATAVPPFIWKLRCFTSPTDRSCNPDTLERWRDCCYQVLSSSESSP